MINWRPDFEHPTTFEDGETMLVAVAVYDSLAGKTRWEISVITLCCDADGMYIEYNDDTWGWDWESVQYWCPISEVVPQVLPVDMPNQV